MNIINIHIKVGREDHSHSWNSLNIKSLCHNTILNCALWENRIAYGNVIHSSSISYRFLLYVQSCELYYKCIEVMSCALKILLWRLYALCQNLDHLIYFLYGPIHLIESRDYFFMIKRTVNNLLAKHLPLQCIVKERNFPWWMALPCQFLWPLFNK